MHLAIVGLENQSVVFLRVAVFDRFYCTTSIVLLAKSDSDVTFCLQSYQGLRIDESLVY